LIFNSLIDYFLSSFQLPTQIGIQIVFHLMMVILKLSELLEFPKMEILVSGWKFDGDYGSAHGCR